MCEWGNTIPLKVTIPADVSFTEKERKTTKKIDRCLAPLIEMLNKYGIKTTSCCCGHGKIKKSYIGIQGKNVHLGVFKNTGLVSMNLEFPYPGKEKK